jgi:exodeoxyribonuclease V beta subunit
MSQVGDRKPHASHSDREVREFSITGPLPSGITVLEASAGTGKTYTIASLAARYVADGVPLEKMLFVTFTRLATGELRERVRERLIEVERRLAAPEAERSADEVVALLAAGDRERHRHRIAQAIAGFDAATILTTHSFCQDMLEGLGIAGELSPDVRFAEDLSDLRDDVVDDLYLRRFRGERAPALDLAESRTIVRVAMTDATAPVVMPDGGIGAMRARLASAGRDELDLRKRRGRLMTYDDYVDQLKAALDGSNREAARAALRSRFDVVLVDEFQDTDPAQWEVLDRGFVQTGTNVVLIGDPKQAIYAFRGADVYAYLRAVDSADERETLLTNWRSDQNLLDAHDALFANAQLGHPGIVYRTVRAAPHHPASRLEGAPVDEAMRFRVVPRDSPLLSTNQWGMIDRPSAEGYIARDLAGDVVALLGSRAKVDGVVVCPGDLAVLVRTNIQASIVHQALSDAGVPAVINGAGSVFATETAQDWLRLLESLERPSATGRAHAAALTCFVGWPAQRLATAIADASPEWEEVHQRLHEWARILRARGVASLVETITAGEDLPARMLATTDGERRLTDLRHIGQLLHGAAVADQLGPTALAAWLRARIDEGEGEEERTRRLESDDEAVQVLTVHRSKGAEFPIVYLPYLWAGWAPRDNPPVYFHEAGAGDERRLDVAREGPEYDRHLRQNTVEQRGEDLRLAYVALTRARHQTVLWWAASAQTRHSALTRLLFSRAEDGMVATDGAAAPKDPAVFARLEQLQTQAPHAISVERAEPDLAAHWSPGLRTAGKLDASAFERSLDLRWRRTSYTDMTAASYDARVGSEPEEPLVDDEPDADEPVAASALAAMPELALPALLGEMPVGAEVGTFVHSVLEATDFAAGDLGAELRARIAEVRARRAVDIGDPEQVAEGLEAMIATPLGDVVGGIALRDVARADRLDELGFELPLAGGDAPTGGLVTMDRIAAVLRETLPAGDPLAGYAARLDDPFLRRTVRGYLTGSLDLVLRLGNGRFAVLDYKTNWLGEPGEPLTSFHYRPAALVAEMYRHHYALQALLYTVALHRFLRWRLDGYDPDTHLAGVAYLFVRGMTGGGGLGFGGAPDGSAPGVFAWRPPSGLAAALSDALDEGVA